MNPKKLTTFIASLLLITFVFSPVSARAHVEGHMPDSVAEMEYRILLEFKPRDLVIRVKLAIVLMNQDKLEEAEKEFKRALAASPRNMQAHMGLSLLRFKQHKTDEALVMIKKALEIDPDNPTIYLNYGLFLEADKRPQEARQMYREGLDKLTNNPKDPEATHNRQQLENALQKVEEKLTKINQAN